MATSYKKLVSCLLLLSGVFLFVSSLSAPALAQSPTGRAGVSEAPLLPREAPPSGINLTVSPSFLNLSTDPGKKIDSEFRVTNNNNFTEYLKIDIAKFAIGEGGKPLLLDVTPADSFVSWVQFPERQFSVTSNQSKTIRFSITPPESASLGYYYAFVLSRVREAEATGQGAKLAGNPALLTLLEVRSPSAKRELQLVAFKTDKLWYEYLPTTFTILVKNTGNVHLAPTGNVFIDQGSRKDIAILNANPSRGNVLPQTEREFTAVWNDGMILEVPKEEDGKQFETKIDFDKPLSSFRIGKYTANLLLVYDNGERDVPLEAQVSFWVIPWKLILGAVLIIFLPLILFSVISKLRRKKK